MTTLKSVAARIVRTIRCLAIGYIAVQVGIWHSFYAADPRRLAGPGGAVVWAIAAVAYLRRNRPGWRLAGIDSGFHVALALSAGWCAAAMRGDTANWLYILISGQLLVPAWFAPTAVFAPLALASAAAVWLVPRARAGGLSGARSPSGPRCVPGLSIMC